LGTGLEANRNRQGQTSLSIQFSGEEILYSIKREAQKGRLTRRAAEKILGLAGISEPGKFLFAMALKVHMHQEQCRDDQLTP
jgi:hypothetical protein